MHGFPTPRHVPPLNFPWKGIWIFFSKSFSKFLFLNIQLNILNFMKFSGRLGIFQWPLRRCFSPHSIPYFCLWVFSFILFHLHVLVIKLLWVICSVETFIHPVQIENCHCRSFSLSIPMWSRQSHHCFQYNT